MKPPPPDWPRLSTSVYYRDAAAAIDWLIRAFGFSVRLKVEGEGGRIEHSELVFGESVVMVGQEPLPGQPGPPWRAVMRSPLSVGGGNTQGIMLYVDDVDAHRARALAAGATVFVETAVHDYGEDYWADKSYGVKDLEGHCWWIAERLRSPARAPWSNG